MGKKENCHQYHCDEKQKDKVEAVLHLLRKQAPLTPKQEKFCSTSCVKRFLKARGENVKKSAKQLRACLSWRDTIAIENLTADEFSTELADGLAFVSGFDDDSKPVVIFRMKQEYHKLNSQKQFTRFLVFTLEVAIQSMSKDVHQFVLLFDASFYRSASAFMSMYLGVLKIISDYYPAQLDAAFVIDPPPLFSVLWKGVKSFVELSILTTLVSSIDYEESNDISYYNQSTAKIGACSSSRFSFTVAHHFDSVKPWYLSLTDTSASKVGPTNASILGPSARSFSFASPVARTPRGNINTIRKSFYPSTPLPQKTQKVDHSNIKQPRTPKPSFLQSPALFFRKECHVSKTDRCHKAFVQFLKFYRRPYDEMSYRAKMSRSLGGLISIISPQLKRRHVSVSQRF